LIVLDSSFLVKLVLEENESSKAREMARSWSAIGEVLVTLDIAPRGFERYMETLLKDR